MPDEPHFDCPTCRDEGLPARVLVVDEAANLATVQMDGGEREVALDLLDGVRVGDYVLVHLAMAIAKLNPADVSET
ncbi:MAG: HypC/HybG/HupF family hydrogenase formation chaperone [Armatimonadota bacterium]|nr:HypC/HybG/HupF family hydrogenase formation chaperone [Armatimonadota bacterium]